MIAKQLDALSRKTRNLPPCQMAIVFKLNNKLIGSFTSVWCWELAESLKEQAVIKMSEFFDPNVVDTIGELSIDTIVVRDAGGEKFDLYTVEASDSGLGGSGSASRQSKETAAHVVLTHLGDRPNPDLVAPIFLSLLNIERRANH